MVRECHLPQVVLWVFFFNLKAELLRNSVLGSDSGFVKWPYEQLTLLL